MKSVWNLTKYFRESSRRKSGKHKNTVGFNLPAYLVGTEPGSNQHTSDQMTDVRVLKSLGDVPLTYQCRYASHVMI